MIDRVARRPRRCVSCGASFIVEPESAAAFDGLTEENACPKCWLAARAAAGAARCFDCGAPLSVLDAPIGVCGDCLAGRR